MCVCVCVWLFTRILSLYHCCIILQVPIVRAGGVEVIVAAARAHVRSVDVSENACMALASLAVDAANKVMCHAWIHSVRNACMSMTDGFHVIAISDTPSHVC